MNAVTKTKGTRFMPDLNEDLSKRESVRKQLLDHYKDVVQGFQDQVSRADETLDYWDVYNCKINGNQFYNGNSSIYVPIVKEAVDARKTRFCNQIFPMGGRTVECTTEDGDTPYAHQALLEHYVRMSDLRQKIMPALLKQGDIEGQYTVYITWNKTTRNVTRRVKKGIKVAGLEIEAAGEVEDIEEEKISDSYPDVQIIADTDFLVLPATADNIPEAIEKGGSVTIAQRMTRREVKDKIKEGVFNKEVGELFLKGFGAGENTLLRNTKKEMASEAGIKVSGGKKFALIFQSWKRIKIGKEHRLCVSYYGNGSTILGSTLNPNWNDRVPVLSVPLNKTAGVFKGISPVKAVAGIQYAANDAVNEGMDSATYSLLPIVMTDPEKNPRVGTMVMNLAAIWETNPNDTKFVTFPQLWRDAFEIVSSCKNEIFQALSVNPAMIPSGNNTKKKNQAEMANEQQVDLLTTADAVTIVQEGILNPMLEMWFEMDHQYRDEDITVRQFGEMGIRAGMEKIEPIQWNNRYHFKWLGVEAARNAQQLQQQIAYMNVLRGIPPQMYPGRTLDMTPLIENGVASVFGPSLAPRIFKDMRSQISVDPEMENMLMDEGFRVEVHLMDDDKLHIQKHMEDIKEKGDTTNDKREHVMAHQAQMAKKQDMMMQKQMQTAAAARGQPGTPGGPPRKPGIAGLPRPGSQAAPATGAAKQPPGAVHRDNMVGPGIMPRKM